MKKTEPEKSKVKILVGCFIVFTICFAIFQFILDAMGFTINEKGKLYWGSIFISYIIVSVVFWPIVKKYLK